MEFLGRRMRIQRSSQKATQFERVADDPATGFEYRRIQVHFIECRTTVDEIMHSGGGATSAHVRGIGIEHRMVVGIRQPGQARVWNCPGYHDETFVQQGLHG